jgi:hypothetical protein
MEMRRIIPVHLEKTNMTVSHRIQAEKKSPHHDFHEQRIERELQTPSPEPTIRISAANDEVNSSDQDASAANDEVDSSSQDASVAHDELDISFQDAFWGDPR